jgi:N-methylhydantoinase B
VIGDIKGQYNANRVGAERVTKLVGEVGLDVYRECGREILEKSEGAMHEAIAQVPDGTYHFVDHFDDFGPNTEPIRVEVTVRVDGDLIEIDYAGSSPATKSGLNAYLPFTRAYARHAVKSIIAPGVPQNSGAMRPIHVTAPEGCFFAARYPTPSGGRAICVRMIVDSVMGAMAQATPDKVTTASSQLCNSTIGGVDERTGRPFVYYDLTFGSTGARPTKDGCDGLVSGFNTGNIPIEIHESVWPVRVEQFGFITDSGGAGTYRGGAAVRRDVRSLASNSRLTNLHDRHDFSPWGLAGGEPGSVGRIVLNPGADSEDDLHSKSIIEVKEGDVVSFRTCGSGGWGDPLDRKLDAVRSDVLDGFVSEESARTIYGVVLTNSDAREVDSAATERLRDDLRRTRSSPARNEESR